MICFMLRVIKRLPLTYNIIDTIQKQPIGMLRLVDRYDIINECSGCLT